MTNLRATYRLQFRGSMTFARAASLAGYLVRLGISHLYASPLFAAVPGSAHGYDGIDFTTIEPAVGGEDAFDALSAVLRDTGLSLLLDFVPNHMAAIESNDWWRSVLEWGVQSPHAGVFDIDWSAPRLLLPILGAPYGQALRDGTFFVELAAEDGGFTFKCGERHLPLTPPSYAAVLARVADHRLAGLAVEFTAAAPDTADDVKRRLAELAREPARAEAVADALAEINADTDLLHGIHEAQVWRLAHWRLACEALTYRRFFEISDLVCLRLEDPAVFDAVHARLAHLVTSEHVSGIRIDHIDGLADPKGYLERLQELIGDATTCDLFVEKILEPGETLRPDWPVAGTTGYEFIAALADVFVDGRREAAMSDAYHAFIGRSVGYAAEAVAAKREMLTHNLAAELSYLAQLAHDIATADVDFRDLGAASLCRAIVELAAALPVYRTYVADSRPSAGDRALIDRAAADAAASRHVENDRAIAFIALLLCHEIDGEAARAFTTRFQQTTGPVMAKAVEDTMFYRYNRLIALNEVGGAPDRYGAPLSAFHDAMVARRETQPGGLSATSTHDTKRGEDARARLYVLSEMPQVWRQAVARWSSLNAGHRTALADGITPEPAMEWHFYQALAGAWPAGFGPKELQHADDDSRLAHLRGRLVAYMAKAAREAKLRTSWTNRDREYERALSAFATAVLLPQGGDGFLVDFARTCTPMWLAGALNSLAQLAIKLVAPGIPDVYQGCELWDFSLVDPDNRNPVDFAARQALVERVVDVSPEALLAEWPSGASKMGLLLAGLELRAERPLLFADGNYMPLTSSGRHSRHIVAFARMLGGSCALVIVPRFVLKLLDGTERPLVPAGRWGDAAVTLPSELQGRWLRDVMTGAISKSGESLPAAISLARFPVGLLVDAD